MDELIRALSKYGPVGLAVAAIAASLLWGIAHLAAAPGHQVSILFGLVSYTRADDRTYLEELNVKSKRVAGTDTEPSERVFIELKPAEITQSFLGMTDLDAESFAADKYLGKWIRISGYVVNVRPSFDDAAIVSIATRSSDDVEYLLVSAKFAQRDYVSHYKRSGRIAVTGRIIHADALGLFLDNAEIVSSDEAG